MNDLWHSTQHDAEHIGAAHRARLQPAQADTIRVGSRRWFVQTGLAGIAGLTLPDLLRCRAEANAATRSSRKSVIIFWLSGGPSHLDTWDPKPDAPIETRGPFETIATKTPGLRFCEHLPLQAAISDKLSVVRAVDCRESNDHRAAVFQTGNGKALLDLKPTFTGPLRGRYPSMGSIAARFRGANDPDLPAFVGVAEPEITTWNSDIWNAGHLGSAYEPVKHSDLAG